MNLELDRSQWKHVKFGDLVQKSKEKVDPSDGTVSRLVGGEHMDSNDLKIHRWGSVDDGYIGPAFHSRFRPGQVLYGSRRTYLRKVAVADFDGVCANTTFVLDPKEPNDLLPTFLPWVMNSEPFHAFSNAESKGSVNPYVNFSDIAKYEFELPPPEQQQRIADLFWVAERHRLAVVNLLAAISLAAPALFNSESKNFETTTLAEWVAKIEAGRSPIASPEPAVQDQLGVLKVSAVGADGFHPHENKRLLDAAAFRREAVVNANDLLITRANAVSDNVARGCIVPIDHPNLMLSDKTLRLVPRTGIPSRVILEALRSGAYRNHVRGAVSGTEAKNISQAAILAGPVPDFPSQKVERLSEELVRTDAVTRSLKDELIQLARFRDRASLQIFGDAK